LEKRELISTLKPEVAGSIPLKNELNFNREIMC
jgi:hypothetical protein